MNTGLIDSKMSPMRVRDEAYDLPAFAGFDEERLLSAPYTKQRRIAKTPYKVLDAPAL
jgi:hypothetical protein